MLWGCTGVWRCVVAGSCTVVRSYTVAGGCTVAEGYIGAEGCTVAVDCTVALVEGCIGVEVGTVAEGPPVRVLRADGRHWPGTHPCPQCM